MAIELINGIELELQGGTRGLQGIQGEKGDPGNDYTPMIGSVDTLGPGLPATVSTSIDEEQNIVYFNFGIPEGEKGDRGDTNFQNFNIINGELIVEDQDGNTMNLGKVAMVAKGNYDNSTSYQTLDTVQYNDSTYMAKTSTLGNLPSDTTYWQLIGGGLQKEDIIDNLNSTSSDKMLSAKQGKILNEGKTQVFDTVALMKAANLKNGMTAQTLGYYSANDGGGAYYKITSTQELTEHQEELNNELYATLVIRDYATPEMLGAYGDNTHDDTTNIQALFDYASTKKAKVILNKKYKITDNININRGINISGSTLNAGIYGNNNTIFIKGGTQTGAYANNSDIMLIESVYFYQISFVLGDTTNDFGCGITFNKCVFFGNNQDTSAIIVKNNTWIFTINDCKIGNYTNGIYFKFKNDDTTRVLNSGAAIKITNTDIFNCIKGIYVIGSALDGYNIMINDCDIEHNNYSIYTSEGAGNNIQCNNLHIEGNSVGSIYADATNIFISNIWDIDSNPNTYIAKFTAINSARIILNSGRLSWNTKKLIKNISSTIYMNLEELVMPPFIYNGQIVTDDSNGYIITNDYYNYVIPANVKTKEYENGNTANLIFLQPNSTNGIEMECVFRQYAPTPSSNTPDITIFFESTSVNANTGLITLPYYSTWVYLKINYVPGTLIVSGYYKVDGGEEVDFCKFVNLTSEDTSENRKIYIRYRYTGTATLQTKRMISKFINNKNLVE